MTGPKPRDEVGKTYGYFRVLRFSHRDGKRRFFVCLCRCGKQRTVQIGSLRSGHTKSCGCRKIDLIRSDKHPRLSHGKTGSPEWMTWCGMKARCLNPRNPKFRLYGGRGITIDPVWRDSFAAFLDDMGTKPSPQHSIDRVDNDGPYAPWNCRWASKKQQANNRGPYVPRPVHPNSLKNLTHRFTPEKARETWYRHNTPSHPKTCDHCGAKFHRRGKPKREHIYCSRHCYFSHRFAS